jgi:adenosyl cobinamide kinase/adenosyl cobinamide phosphate guanylyltransferase
LRFPCSLYAVSVSELVESVFLPNRFSAAWVKAAPLTHGTQRASHCSHRRGRALDVVVVDCLTIWLSNLLLRDDSAEAILTRVDAVVRALTRRRFHAILVTNEVGMSVHPPTVLGRAFVEIVGWSHQRIAAAADDVYLAILGTMVRIRPSPELARVT